MNANERFEKAAAEFYRNTGYLAPGKSVPMCMASEDYDRQRHEAWNKWRKKKNVYSDADRLADKGDMEYHERIDNGEKRPFIR